MFAHHILKPERAPIEANVWGTPKSSGSFSNLFRTRLVRLSDYRPIPLRGLCATEETGKTYDASQPLSRDVCKILGRGPRRDFTGATRHLSLLRQLPLHRPAWFESVDLVVTDPPFLTMFTIRNWPIFFTPGKSLSAWFFSCRRDHPQREGGAGCRC